jgi:CheY-like chemotaxis protein
MPPPRVLVVDDDPSARLHAQRLLTARGMRAETVASPEDALELVRTREGTELAFDAVLTDDRMPFMTGWEMMEHLARDHPRVVRILSSGYQNGSQDLRRSELPHWFLTKPISEKALHDALGSSLRARR